MSEPEEQEEDEYSTKRVKIRLDMLEDQANQG
jgi:hypothetical protein